MSARSSAVYAMVVFASLSAVSGCASRTTSALLPSGATVTRQTSPFSWTTKAPMPTARSFLAAGHINRSIILAVGGMQGGRDLNTVEAYDYTTDTWTTKASMPTARAHLAVGVINGILYAVGGDQNGAGALNTVEAYDLSKDTWVTKAPMLTARSGPAVGVIRDKNNHVLLYAVGGEDANGNFLNTVEAYNPAKNKWTAKASMPAQP